MPKAANPKPGLLTDSWGRANNRHLGDRPCQQCGKVFRPLRMASKYCSRSCAWKNNGGRNRKLESIWWRNAKGYIEGRVWVGGKRVQVKQHRWFVELFIGRKLKPTEDVHHKNGIKSDNRLENLEVIDHGKHTTLSMLGKPSRNPNGRTGSPPRKPNGQFAPD